MKFCFVTTGDIKDIATSKRAFGMANPLDKLGWEVHIVLEDTRENKMRADLECKTSINLHYYPTSTALKESFIKNQIVKAISPDFVYVCAFVFRNIVFGKYIKLVEHSELQSGMAENKNIMRRFKPLLFEYLSIAYSDSLLYASRYLERAYYKRLTLFHKKDMPQLYFPYAYSSELLQINQIEKRSTKKFIFVYLGSLVKNYGLFTMIKAFELLYKQNKNAVLFLLGEGPDENEAARYIKSNGLSECIVMPGYIPENEIQSYFEQADAFISPMNDTVQDWARCPSKVYMYLPYCKPIITCKIGEPYEVLGEKGYYYNSGDFTSMANVCEKVTQIKDIPESINPEHHTWTTRSVQFHDWIMKSYIM